MSDAATPLLFARGHSINDNKPVQIEVADFAAFVAALDANRAALKVGAGYVCGPLNGDGRRCAEGALPRRWLALDLDRIHADRLGDVFTWCWKFSGCAWETHSSRPEAPRARVILELARDATRDECIKLGDVLAGDLADEFGDEVMIDPSTFRGEQPVFVPPVSVRIARFEGSPLDVDAHLQAWKPPAKAPERATTHDHDEGGTVAAGGRNAALSREAFRLRKQGLSVKQITDVLLAMNKAACDPPLPEAEVRGIAAGKSRIAPDPVAPDDGAPQDAKQAGAVLTDFYAHMPSHQYLFVPTRELWPSSSVNGRVPWPKVGEKAVAPASWLDAHRPVEQMAWHPAEPQVIADRVLQTSGWARHDGARVFNLYRAPDRPAGDAGKSGPWLDHIRYVYPDDADHIIRWLAHRVQHPGAKCNHALVLAGLQGIGKDTLLEPVKSAIGPWNWSEISPAQMLGRFNGWAKAVIVRVNEARDLGDTDRFAFYDHSKAIIAAPPDVLRVDEKHLRETYVVNCCGVVITTNHLGDGLYLPADDRRHYVAWSPRSRVDFDGDYWPRIYGWFAAGGIGHVCAYLAALDLADFDAKAPPTKTAAFWQVVAAGDAPESGELRDVIDKLGNPKALTLQQLVTAAEYLQMQSLADELRDRKQRRALQHKLARVRYALVRNIGTDDGYFSIGGRRVAVYAQDMLTVADQIRAARALS